MKQVFLILIFVIFTMPLRLYSQTDSLVNNDFFNGSILFLNGKEAGHSKGYLKGQKTIRDTYYTDENTILVIEKDSVTKSILRIDICNVHNDTLSTIAAGWVFQNDTMLRSYFYQLPKWGTSDSTISYRYYPNGLLSSKSALLKTNHNYGTHVFYYPTQEVENLTVSTDTTVIETDYAKNGNIRFVRMYHLNKQLYDSWIKNGGIQNAPLIPMNTDKHGEWLYYDEKGRLIKKEIYEFNELKKTIEYTLPKKERKSKR